MVSRTRRCRRRNCPADCCLATRGSRGAREDGVSGASPDAQVARDMYEAELKHYQDDGEIVIEERSAAPITTASATPAPEASSAIVSASGAPIPSIISTYNASAFGTFNSSLPTSATPQAVPRIATYRCVVCEDEFDKVHRWQAPCKQYYCIDHLNTLFQHSLADSTLYPPSCCKQNIPFEAVKNLLDKDLSKRFADRKEELDDQKPIYCCVSKCSTYIGQSNKVGMTAICSRCWLRTCISCKHAAHEGDCEEDEDTTQMLDIAQKKGWRRCPQCERMVELRTGCNHMTLVSTSLAAVSPLILTSPGVSAKRSFATSVASFGGPVSALNSNTAAYLSLVRKSRRVRIPTRKTSK